MQRVTVFRLWFASLELAQPCPNPLRCSSCRFPLPIYLRPRVQRLDLPKLLQQRSFQRQSHPKDSPRPLCRVILHAFPPAVAKPPALRRSCTGYAGAIRKLVHDGRLRPVSRRGGRGTLLFSLEDLDTFLRGGRPVPSEADRQVAPQLNEAPHDQLRQTEENEVQKRVRHPNRRSLRTSPGHRPDHGTSSLRSRRHCRPKIRSRRSSGYRERSNESEAAHSYPRE
jgi:hypothetical protein